MRGKYCFRKNTEGQVLGLPMYLIIVMIVAVAVIAAVIFMIPQGTRTMSAQVTANALIAETAGDAGAFTFTNSYQVVITVTTNDERADPISGATVTLVGAGAAVEGTTGNDGTVTLPGFSPTLNANVNEAYMKLIVKATGFEDFEDVQAVSIVRLS